MFTSCYKRIKQIQPPLEPVCISVGRPPWYTGRCEPRLYPTRDMLKLDPASYDQAYNLVLAQLDPAQIYHALGANAVLLCWEPPNIRCHRRLVAEWFERALGVEVAEFGFTRSECPAYAAAPTSGGHEPSDSGLRVLTVKQPWAWAIGEGHKLVENRGWQTDYRGPLAIHAGKSRELLTPELLDAWTGRYAILTPKVEKLVFGAIIAVADLTDCVPLAQLPADLVGHPFAEGEHCWVIRNARRVTPFPCSGNMRLWLPPPGFVAAETHHDPIRRESAIAVGPTEHSAM
jgi:hypothetical protein